MNPIEQLKIISETSYKDYEGDEFRVKLKEGLSNQEIEILKSKSPTKTLSKELEELLKFSKGISVNKGFLDDIKFDNFQDFGFEELIEFNLTITHDWTGNYWIQEINSKGEWGKIYYVCHDPAVIIKQANSLGEFLNQLHHYFLDDDKSFFSRIYNQISFDIYSGKGRLLEHKEAIDSNDKRLKNFAKNYDEDWFIADLRNAENGEGFRLEASYKETIRLEDELIWALKKYKNFWTRLKEKFKKKKAAANNG